MVWIFSSLKYTIALFFSVLILIAIVFWLYLNIQASMQVSAQRSLIELPDNLATQIDINRELKAQATGSVATSIELDQEMTFPLKGKYLTQLNFDVVTPVIVNIDYETIIKIKTLMPLETSTDLIYQKKYLPRFPLKLDVPIDLEVPFKLKKSYQVPIRIKFDAPIYVGFDESINLYVNHHFQPKLNINDDITLMEIKGFKANLKNIERQTEASLDLILDLPLRNIRSQ